MYACNVCWNAYKVSGYACNFFGKRTKKFLALAVLVACVQGRAERVQSLDLRVKLFWHAYQKIFTAIASSCTRATGLGIPTTSLVRVKFFPQAYNTERNACNFFGRPSLGLSIGGVPWPIPSGRLSRAPGRMRIGTNRMAAKKGGGVREHAAGHGDGVTSPIRRDRARSSLS